jgi:hypothetical protein
MKRLHPLVAQPFPCCPFKTFLDKTSDIERLTGMEVGADEREAVNTVRVVIYQVIDCL